MENLIWSRLKNLKCPKCNTDILREDDGSFVCTKKRCSFKIELHTFDKVVSSTYKSKRYNYQQDNQEALNNL